MEQRGKCCGAVPLVHKKNNQRQTDWRQANTDRQTDRLEAGKHRQADRQTGIDIKQTTELHNTPFAVQLLVRLMTGTGELVQRDMLTRTACEVSNEILSLMW